MTFPNAKLRSRLSRHFVEVQDCLARALEAAAVDNNHPVDYGYLLSQLQRAQERLEMMQSQARQNAELQGNLEMAEGSEG